MMEKKYDHKTTEPRIYKMWEEGGYFTPKIDKDKKPYTIVLPPPNANGILHVGNALMLAIEDTLIRWKRMQGYSVLWLPGTDHAGFETQAVYEKQLEKEDKSRFDFDRDTLYQKTFDFVEKQKAAIDVQIRSMGPSLDWSRATYTLDPHVIETVYNTFEKMADDKLIYRDDYVVNYCTKHATTLSDLELEHKDQKTSLYYIRYRLVDKKDSESDYIVVATARPEPIFVDTHLAVNPKDKKNTWLVGRKLLNPLTDKEMEVIEDSFVDSEFGTGVVKLTPAHDKTDFQAALRHGLPVISAFGTNGRIDKSGGELAGLTIKEARKKALEILTEKDLIEKINEKYENTIATCYKCGTVIEPLVLPNWFVKVESLKKPAHDVVKDGEVLIYPKWQETKYDRWMEEMRDWPISRQIVWGIRLPVWYNVLESGNIRVTFLSKDKKVTSGSVGELLKEHKFEEIEKGLQTLIAPTGAEYKISKEKPQGQFLQDTDVFDTWFSSGHWPLATLHYPDSEDFKYFYPTAVLETGWEILRFWVSRMIMFGIYLTGKAPFRDVYLHGLVRAVDGRKMSKSLGNQVDPLEFVEEFGADALRMGLISGTANGKDFNFPQDKVKAYRNFANKIWNMARFMQMMMADAGEVPVFSKDLETNDADKIILSGLNELIKAVDVSLGKYRFSDAGDAIYHFMWNEVADKYIEDVKGRGDKAIGLSVLKYVFENCMKLLHPFMPFVTEEIWGNLGNEVPLIISSWPKVE